MDKSSGEHDRLIMGGGPKPLPAGAPPRLLEEESGDIVDLILRDHIPLKELLETLKNRGLKRSAKQNALEEFVPLLLSHAKAEEQSLYFALRANPDFRIAGFQGVTEHLIAEELAQKINATPDDDDWSAKVKVLAEAVLNHIKEEETDILVRFKEHINNEARSIVGREYVRLKLDYDLLKVSPKRETLGTAENRLH